MLPHHDYTKGKDDLVTQHIFNYHTSDCVSTYPGMIMSHFREGVVLEILCKRGNYTVNFE